MPFASANLVDSNPAVTVFKAPNSLSDLIVHWYCLRLYSKAWAVPALYDIRKCAKLIEYSKRFMDPGTIIDIPKDGENYVTIITPIAATVQTRVIKFFNTPNVVSILKMTRADQTCTIREIKSVKVWAA